MGPITSGQVIVLLVFLIIPALVSIVTLRRAGLERMVEHLVVRPPDQRDFPLDLRLREVAERTQGLRRRIDWHLTRSARLSPPATAPRAVP